VAWATMSVHSKLRRSFTTCRSAAATFLRSRQVVRTIPAATPNPIPIHSVVSFDRPCHQIGTPKSTYLMKSPSILWCLHLSITSNRHSLIAALAMHHGVPTICNVAGPSHCRSSAYAGDQNSSAEHRRCGRSNERKVRSILFCRFDPQRNESCCRGRRSCCGRENSICRR